VSHGGKAPPVADALVVLGAAAGSDALRRRIEHAVVLYRSGAAPYLILCGGAGEAEAMRAVALAGGVPDEAMLLDARSTSTFENAREAARLMQAHALSTAVLVSEGYHLPRARMLFRLHGVAIAAVSAARSGSLRHRATMTLRELLTIPANLLRLAAFICARGRR
jgi:uncharacterized SAM-binding protein YcdF (DUF218 family)